MQMAHSKTLLTHQVHPLPRYFLSQIPKSSLSSVLPWPLYNTKMIICTGAFSQFIIESYKIFLASTKGSHSKAHFSMEFEARLRPPFPKSWAIPKSFQCYFNCLQPIYNHHNSSLTHKKVHFLSKNPKYQAFYLRYLKTSTKFYHTNKIPTWPWSPSNKGKTHLQTHLTKLFTLKLQQKQTLVKNCESPIWSFCTKKIKKLDVAGNQILAD